jgi:hypothetical protein
VNITNSEASCYAVFSIILLFSLLGPNILLSTLFSEFCLVLAVNEGELPASRSVRLNICTVHLLYTLDSHVGWHQNSSALRSDNFPSLVENSVLVVRLLLRRQDI